VSSSSSSSSGGGSGSGSSGGGDGPLGVQGLLAAGAAWLTSTATSAAAAEASARGGRGLAELHDWLAYVDQFEGVMLAPLLDAWATLGPRPDLVVCDRWSYACLDAAEALNLPLVVYSPVSI
jgi:hypothetical protein